MSTTRRQNGWQTPFNRYQINLWIVFPLIAVHYFAFLYPMLWNLTTEIVVTIIFGTAFVSASIAGCICTTVNPADNFVVSCNTEGHEDKDRVYCYLCEINVGLTSKHCRYCDKCVVGFDHHCVWLNTCIGSKNYHWFFVTVIASALFTVTSTVLSLALLIDSFNTPDRISSLSYFTPITLHGVQALLFLSVMVFLGWTSMVCQLGGFHIYLVSRGITTYDFIVEQQQKSTERNKQKENKLLEKQSGTTTAPEATDCCGGSGCNQPQKPSSPLQTDGQVDQYTQLASNNNMFASPSRGPDASSAGTMAVAKGLGGDIEQCMMDKGPGLVLPSDNADQCGKAVRAVGGGDGDDALDAIRPSSSNSNSTPTLPLTISNHGYPAMAMAATGTGGTVIVTNSSSASGNITRNVNAAEFYPGQYISPHAGVSEEVGMDQVDVVRWSTRPPPPLASSPVTTNPTASSTGGLPGAPRARAPAVTTSSSSSAAAVAVIVSAPSSSSSAIATATAPSSSSSAPSSSLVVQRVDKGQAKRQMAASMALARSTSASLATTPAATPWTSPFKPPTAQLGPQPHHLQPQHPQQQFPLRTSTNPSVQHNITTVSGGGSGGISAYPSATSVNTLGTFSVDTVPPPAPPAYSPHASPSTRAAMRENAAAAAAAAREGGGGGVITTPGIILVPLQVVMDHNLDESLRPI